MNNYLSVHQAENIWRKSSSIVTRTTINAAIRDNKIPSITVKARHYIDKSYVEKTVEIISEYVYIPTIIKKKINEYHLIDIEQKHFKRNINSKLKKYYIYTSDNDYLIPFSKPLMLKSNMKILEHAIEEEILKYIKSDYIPLNKAEDILNTSSYKIKVMLQEEGIEKKWLVEKYIFQPLLLKSMQSRKTNMLEYMI